jgi:peptidoglycan/xylan/chitin deacetylase (PgdA/CDA1 family)
MRHHPLADRWYQAQRWLSRRLMRRDLLLQGNFGVVSFSFDDAPKSACVEGRRILESMNSHGTWYIAGGLTDRLELGRMCHSAADVQSLARNGHHVGCHTFSHQPCDRVGRTQVAAEFQRNAAFFTDLGLEGAGQHFSFPLGAYDLGSKYLASNVFRSSRLITGGVQVGRADLNGLWAEKLYALSMTPARLQSLVQSVAEQRGWLIFYSHEVEQQPGAMGCTPALLDYAVRASLGAGCKVLSVEQAIAYWSAQQ